jgi:hypothetical protein
MMSIDRLPYSLLGAVVGATGFLLGNAVFHKAAWQLVAAPIVGGILGLAAAAWVLRDMKLPFASTLGDVKVRQAHKDGQRR